MLKNLRLSSDPVRSYHPSGTVDAYAYSMSHIHTDCKLHRSHEKYKEREKNGEIVGCGRVLRL